MLWVALQFALIWSSGFLCAAGSGWGLGTGVGGIAVTFWGIAVAKEYFTEETD